MILVRIELDRAVAIWLRAVPEALSVT